MFLDGDAAFNHMLLHIIYDQIYSSLALNWMFTWTITSLICLGYWIHLSVFPSLFLQWKYIIYSQLSVRPVCGCNPFVYCFVFFVPKYDCWFLFGMFVYLFHIISLHVYFSFHCRLQYFYWTPFSLWYYHIGSCWLCITYLICSWNFNLFLVFLNWRIFSLVGWIVIITYYVLLQLF